MPALSDIFVRKAAEEDLAVLAAIEREVFTGEAWTEGMFRVYIDMPEAVFLVAEENETVVGYIVIETVTPDADIFNVCVIPSHRRKGIARALLAEGMRKAREIPGVSAFTLACRASNTPARTLYESLGFVYEGARPGYYTHPREDAAIYWIRNAST